MKRVLGLFLFGCATPTDPGSNEPVVMFGNDESDSDASVGWSRDDDGACPDTWVLTYALDGRVDITHTPLNLGNADADVGGLDTDELVIRMPDAGGAPVPGQVQITAFELTQAFEVSVNMFGDITIVSDLLLFADDECGLSSGSFDGSAVEWDRCEYGPDHGSNDWGPDDGASGPGCLNDYQVEGVIECVDDSLVVSCADGWLDEGENVFDYAYNQPMLDLQFDGSDLQRFTMVGADYGAEVPTYSNNRTWLSLTGELKTMSLERTPDCLCEG